MKEKYIKKQANSYKIIKNSKNYGKFQNPQEAVFIRDELIKNNWNPESLNKIYKISGRYIILTVNDGKIHIPARFTKKPSKSAADEIIKKYRRNPNGSKYGLNISKISDIFIIRKQIAGEEYIYGYYGRLKDAEFVRNFLLDNNWDVNLFSKIHYDDGENNYKVCEVIDGKVYVLESFSSKSEIDLKMCHREFLNKILKHKLGLAMYPYLDELCGKIHVLEKRFNTKADDNEWDLKNTQNPLNDIIFTLTPFEQSVYDAVDDSTVTDIEKSLIRFKSSNFTAKIQKNLKSLMDKGLITKKKNHYIKQKR